MGRQPLQPTSSKLLTHLDKVPLLPRIQVPPILKVGQEQVLVRAKLDLAKLDQVHPSLKLALLLVVLLAQKLALLIRLVLSQGSRQRLAPNPTLGCLANRSHLDPQVVQPQTLQPRERAKAVANRLMFLLV